MSNSSLDQWDVENQAFWNRTGRRIAIKNLIFSLFPEFLAFSIWQLWSIINPFLLGVGFNFSTNQLFWLSALPGLTGATLRLPYAFMVPILGGRNWTIISTALFFFPLIGIAIAIQNIHTPYYVFVLLALLCGLGGGNFASSMANINYFFPSRLKGLALGINAAGGNLGVSFIQFIVPIVIATEIFGSWGGHSQAISNNGVDVIWLQNATLLFIPLVFLSLLTSWFFMDNLTSAQSSIRKQFSMLKDKHAWIMSILYIGTFGSFIGYSASFPLLIKLYFPQMHFIYIAFLGPLIGSLVRPFGGWLSDKLGGAKVTYWNFIVMCVSTCLVLFFINMKSDAFIGFFSMFMVLFITTGIGNGSTYKMIPTIYIKLNKKKYGENFPDITHISNWQTTAVIGITSAIGAYGAFIIPKTYGTSIALTGNVNAAFFLFISFYLVCIFMTWFYYIRKKALIDC